MTIEQKEVLYLLKNKIKVSEFDGEIDEDMAEEMVELLDNFEKENDNQETSRI